MSANDSATVAAAARLIRGGNHATGGKRTGTTVSNEHFLGDARQELAAHAAWPRGGRTHPACAPSRSAHLQLFEDDWRTWKSSISIGTFEQYFHMSVLTNGHFKVLRVFIFGQGNRCNLQLAIR